MPALNFKKEFAPLIESGKKRQTIRQVRKNPIKAGDKLTMFTGQRTGECRKLRQDTCIAVSELHILENGTIKLEGQSLHNASADDMAKKDGFEDRHEMVAFFMDLYGLPFEGVLIQW